MSSQILIDLLNKAFPPETRNLQGIWEQAMRMMETTQAKLKDMGASDHETIHTLLGKSKELLAAMVGNSGLFLTGLLEKAFPPEVRNLKEMVETIWAKLKGLSVMVQSVALFLMGLLDRICPPETRNERIKHWIWVCAPYVAPVIVFVVLFWCCGNKGDNSGKMMKAPGRDFKIPRSKFAANPKGYFRGLHAAKHKKA